jgi:hypothetical protein
MIGTKAWVVLGITFDSKDGVAVNSDLDGRSEKTKQKKPPAKEKKGMKNRK